MEGYSSELMNVIKYWMQGEITNLLWVWVSAVLSLIYCHSAAKILPAGATRLAAFLPVVAFFLFLPMNLYSIHFCGLTGFFLAWLANFKLLMFAFGEGPLADNPSISLPTFLALASFPIKLKTLQNNVDQLAHRGNKSFWNYAVKSFVLIFLFRGYGYADRLPHKVVLFMYGLHIYLSLEIILAVGAAAARGLLGAELEPQFDEPYLSSSLQDFWGRRWNIMVSRILRPTVYQPVHRWAAEVVGRERAALPAVMATFVVSGLMHELIFYYVGRVRPTWEITWFFVLHGAWLVVEIVLKKAVNGRWRLPRAVGTILTLGSVTVTGFWLFFPQFLRCKAPEKGAAEIAAAMAFVKDVVSVVIRS